MKLKRIIWSKYLHCGFEVLVKFSFLSYYFTQIVIIMYYYKKKNQNEL